jgi:DNA-directed RNA polymerase sigma subunit (sigma70/sigma32)
MNTYGKKTEKSDASDEQVKGYTFLSWAAYKIRIFIIENIKDNGHLVRVPRSQQNRERSEKGHNTKSYSISVETPVGRDKEGNSKRLLDKIGDYERAGKSMEDDDNARLWENIHRILSKKFDSRSLNVFYDKWGVNGHKKLSGKEIMEKYGFKNQSNINAIDWKTKHFMITDPVMKDALLELYEFNESRKHDDDMEDSMFETRKLMDINTSDDD